ncbi:hypothetical protein EYF80_010509 [Liparis tanakae]|uniref:Uncharacterized protein n=1 Tax=Liparis tanakae TaxID=230148 RepID=A0A4Z2IP74_9TELE|nr:hypothetical protein EYF80_010509 [Liparis tanakae]
MVNVEETGEEDPMAECVSVSLEQTSQGKAHHRPVAEGAHAVLGAGTEEMPPGLTALHVSLRQCLLICKSLMAFNSHEWMGRDSIKSLS